MIIFFVTLGVFFLSAFFLYLGYIISGKEIKGSCGGINCCSKKFCEGDQSKKL